MLDNKFEEPFFVIELTLSGDFVYNASAASWNSCQEWMYTIAHRGTMAAADEECHLSQTRPDVRCRITVKDVPQGPAQHG